ncbi:MAG: ABC transporter permease, partial [Butyricicoccaceae bacterium]
YRMKRNGAGLASICILLTMVLVMLSSTAALYIGAEDSLRTRYPRDICMDVYVDAAMSGEEGLKPFREAVDAVLADGDVHPLQVMDYRNMEISGLLADGTFSATGDFDKSLADLINLYLIQLEDYNRAVGRQAVLEDGQVLLYPFRTGYTAETFQIQDGPTWQVLEVLDDFMIHDSASVDIVPSVFLVVPDLSAAAAPLEAALGESLSVCWTYGFDLDLEAEKQIGLYHALQTALQTAGPAERSYRIESLEANRGDFYGTYGGLFFLGILLSLVFLAAAVLIIYYKQVSEGYEDQARFGIMRKVGMTARDIRASINSQMRTVFFLPLLMAGIHLCFAFPMVRKLLMLFNLWNTRLLAETSVFCFVAFGLFYCVVYWMTSNAYYAIVSGMHPEDAAV